MKSSACKHDEHDLCPIFGRVRRADGKVFKCDCPHHPSSRVVVREEQEEEEEEE